MNKYQNQYQNQNLLIALIQTNNMCGIIGAIINPKAKEKINANEFIINQFEDQHSRGKEGFGIIRFTNKKIEGIDRACTPMKFLMDLYQNKAESIIAHHRQPTSTDNKMAQTHPIFLDNKELKYDYLVIHNGMIRNDKVLKEIHEKIGYKYSTEYQETRYYGYNSANASIITKFNDSETMAIDLARFIEKKQTEMKIEGSAAFVAVQIKKNSNKIKRIYFGRRYNPINMKSEKDYLLLSSEGPGEEIPTHKLLWMEIAKPEFKATGEFLLHSRSLKFEDERLEAEKKTLETKKEKENMKEIRKKNDKTIAMYENKNQTKLIPDVQEKIEEKETKPEPNKAFFESIAQGRNEYETQLQVMDDEYWDEAKAGTDRGTLKISNDFEEAIESRQELISEILQSFNDMIMEPGYDKDVEKPRKQMVLSMISKILTSLENIANYENFNLEQAELLENGEDMMTGIPSTSNMDYTPESMRGLSQTEIYEREC